MAAPRRTNLLTTLSIAALIAIAGRPALAGQPPSSGQTPENPKAPPPPTPAPAEPPKAAPPAPSAPAEPTPAPARPSVVEHLKAEAEAIRPLIQSDAVKGFLDAAARLPEPTERTVYRGEDRTKAYAKSELAALSDEQKKGFKAYKFAPEFYYYTRYGSPMIYARPLDILAQRAHWGLADGFKGKRILDFGYGLIGHLRMLALRGADVTGVEVEPMLRALYAEPGDTGEIDGGDGFKGHLRVLHGRWPAEEPVTREVAAGGPYDLIISKNTLKRGYIHPAREVDEKFLVKLGVDDQAFVRKLHDSLKPGGYALIYNISPAQSAPDKPYLPHADGQCPFGRDLLEKTGFEVLEFDRPDTDAILDVWMALGINGDKGRDDMAQDLFAWYTLLRRR